MYYVTMVDKFMSFWGLAKNKVNVLVFKCNTLKEAEIVQENARSRSDMAQIKIRKRLPKFDEAKYFVQYKDKEVYPSWYKEGYFKKD